MWTHIEKLTEEKELELDSIKHLQPKKNWQTAYEVIEKGIRECGTEKLKPIFEYAKEKYDYDLVRLARIQYLLETK